MMALGGSRVRDGDGSEGDGEKQGDRRMGSLRGKALSDAGTDEGAGQGVRSKPR